MGGSGVRASVVRSIAVPTSLVVLYFAVPSDGRWLWPAILLAVAAVVAIVPITVRRIEMIQRSDHPMADALEAVALMVSLLLVSFSAAYYSLARNTDQFPGLETRIDAFYFTVTTLATVGFGDLVPVGQGARAMVAVQILLNLSVIGGSIRVVAGAAAERRALTQQELTQQERGDP